VSVAYLLTRRGHGGQTLADQQLRASESG
jgi:hypothetical protein